MPPVKKPAKKTIRLPLWGWGLVGAAVLGIVITVVMMLPSYAGWRYGACKVILEQYVRFPTTIDIKVGGESESSAVVGFSDINPFGAEQIRIFECYYSQNSDGGVTLSKLTMDRKALPEEVVKRFNQMLPIIVQEKLDTKLPPDLPDDLEGLKE